MAPTLGAAKAEDTPPSFQQHLSGLGKQIPCLEPAPGLGARLTLSHIFIRHPVFTPVGQAPYWGRGCGSCLHRLCRLNST